MADFTTTDPVASAPITELPAPDLPSIDLPAGLTDASTDIPTDMPAAILPDELASPSFDMPDLAPIDDVSCFLEGTMLATPSGERAVESLAIGDALMLSNGSTAPIQWIGRRRMYKNGPGGFQYADPLLCMPIRIRAGALAPNVPTHDLLLSHDHAVLIQDVLAQAAALVNGTSVVRETRVPDSYVYYHIEMQEHSIVMANGAPAETFVDNIDRNSFDNGVEYTLLYPDGRSIVELPFPRVKSARQLPAHIRKQVGGRALVLAA